MNFRHFFAQILMAALAFAVLMPSIGWASSGTGVQNINANIDPRVTSSWCRVVRPPQVSIRTDTDRINWVFNIPQNKLNSFEVDTINPYGNSIHTDVGGLMKGGIGMLQTMRFNTVTNNMYKQSCIFYDTITVKLKIEPSIYIASEYPPGSCKHNAIKEHELKHINMDRQIVNKYAQIVGRAIKAEIDSRSLYGPISIAQETSIRELMRTRMETILRKVNDQMETERRSRQQAIDNINEYERVNSLCR